MENKNIKSNFTKVSTEVKKSLTEEENQNVIPTTQEKIWKALVSPARAVEVIAWLKNHKEAAIMMKGSKGESMLHWAVMSEYSLILDLISAGIDPNAKDNEGLTPLDWLVLRFWQAIVEKKGSRIINAEGILKIRAQTIDLGTVLWSNGGRSGKSESSLHAGEAWIRGGAWPLLELMKSTEGIDSLKNWFSDKRSALHVWVLAEETVEKHKQLENMLKWGIDINEEDVNGRTPLWYAVEAWIVKPQWEKTLIPAIKSLLKHGADPLSEDKYGISPNMVFANRPDAFGKAIIFEEIIKEIVQE